MRSTAISMMISAFLCFVAPSSWAGEASNDADAGPSADEISRMLDNPLGNLWILMLENDIARYRGTPADGSQWVNTTIFQPVLPIPLTDKWNLVTRPIITLLNAPRVDAPADQFGDCPGNCNSRPPPDDLGLRSLSADRKTRWGDISMWSMVSPTEPVTLGDGGKLVWGAGGAFQFPTATTDQFGSEKYTFGPSILALRQPPADGRWTYGLLQHHYLWSVGGAGDRERVKVSKFMYIWWYKPNWSDPDNQWKFGTTPTIQANWQASSDDRWLVPLGVGATNTFFVGKMPVRIGFGFDWYIVTADNYGPKFMFKFFVVPVVPRLIKKPIFGSTKNDMSWGVAGHHLQVT